jgi:hypothetical protein
LILSGAALLGCVSDAPTTPQSSVSQAAPVAASGAPNAPPEGVAAGGLDFGKWRSVDPAIYAPAFQTRVRAWAGGKDMAALKTGLTANGFNCREGALNNRALECRLEIMERQCGIDWWVVLPRPGADLQAGHDVMCLGAMPAPQPKPKQ